MPAVVILLQTTNDHPPAGAGMNELIILEIHPHMAGNPFLPAIVEEYQVSFAQAALAHLAAILGALAVRASLQLFVVHLFIEVRGQARTVYSSFAIAAAAIGDSQPFGGFHIQLVVVFHLNIYAQAYGGARQFLVVIAWRRSAARGQQSGQRAQYQQVGE